MSRLASQVGGVQRLGHLKISKSNRRKRLETVQSQFRNSLNFQIKNLINIADFGRFYVTDEYCWWNISIDDGLSEDFIRRFQDKVDWKLMSSCQILSEPFIEEFQDKVHWERISMYQKLSEDFIRKHQDEIDWSAVSEYQNLSMNFILEFKDKVDWQIIVRKHDMASFASEYTLMNNVEETKL